MRIVVALGGNAILQPRGKRSLTSAAAAQSCGESGQRGTFTEQRANIHTACSQLRLLIADGHRLVLTHGNGPQVGNILLQNEEARLIVPPAPLDVCGAQTQGMIGYLLQQEMQRQTGLPAVALVTQVIVDADDPAFANPTKPVGPFYTPDLARQMMTEAGWAMREDAGRGWRRVVPSPPPRRVVEVAAIRALVDAGMLVIACGGGGAPVVETKDGLTGVEAVIDKDLAAGLLARELQADLLLILTDVPRVCIHYGTPRQQALERVTVEAGEQYLADGHFKAGSMQPKMQAALRFVREGGGRAVIASLAEASAAVRGHAGTQVVRG